MKRIGIPGYRLGENSFGVGISYLEFISSFGKPVIIMPQDVVDPPEVDLLILPGGPDILPSNYDNSPSFRTGQPSVMLEHFDKHIFPQYLKNETPIFGICRGMQLIWKYFGGDLIQHDPYHKQSNHQSDQCHELVFADNISKEFQKSISKVTSRHHQTCSSSYRTPDELNVIAWSKEGNSADTDVVEIIQHKYLPIFGVQFHPEDHDMTDQLSPFIIRQYLEGNKNVK